MLDLKNISKTFNPGTVNEKVALENVNLHLDDGDFATIVGSNGAGKSTLFNAIAGEFIADTGTITLDGRDITFLPDFKRSKAIGRMFQDPLRGTAPHMTIEENLALAFLRASGHTSAFSRISKKDRELFAEKLSALGLGLEDRMKQPVGLLCVDILRRAGVEVTIAAVGGEKIVKSARQISVVADALAEELDYTVFDACILPGGIPGVPNLKADATVRRVCRDFAAEGKVVAAICAAPTALAAFGVLNGKKATVYPGMDADLTAAGASYTGLPLTIDGSIVTGEALGAAIPFALALARILAGADAANRVKSAIVYQ